MRNAPQREKVSIFMGDRGLSSVVSRAPDSAVEFMLLYLRCDVREMLKSVYGGTARHPCTHIVFDHAVFEVIKRVNFSYYSCIKFYYRCAGL